MMIIVFECLKLASSLTTYIDSQLLNNRTPCPFLQTRVSCCRQHVTTNKIQRFLTIFREKKQRKRKIKGITTFWEFRSQHGGPRFSTRRDDMMDEMYAVQKRTLTEGRLSYCTYE